MYEAESHLSSWFELSMLLMTGSLVFYHMTRIKHPSLPVTPWVSALVSSGLIVCGVIYCLSALVPYNLRVQYELETHPNASGVVHEGNYVIMYNVIGAIMVLLQLIICVYIIKDSWERTLKLRKR